MAINKILVADDEVDVEQLIRQKYRQKIREGELEFEFAMNGREALEKIKAQPDIDMVLSDINMPEMDGLSLLRHIGEYNPLLKTVIVSAYGDMDNIRSAMNLGAFDFITKPINFEDLTITMDKTLKQSLQLKDTIKAIKENNILKMYVDHNVINFMASHEFESSLHKNENIEGTVVFIDICGFTRISESLPPDLVVQLLNDSFNCIVQAIVNKDGRIDKFIGDAVMAVFVGENHLNRALEASLSIKNNICDLKKIPGIENETIEVSIGINAGEMISGNIGSTELKRLDYTVIGDTVNTAQRLQSAAKPSQILILEPVNNLISSLFSTNDVGLVTLKNKAGQYRVFEVLG